MYQNAFEMDPKHHFGVINSQKAAKIHFLEPKNVILAFLQNPNNNVENYQNLPKLTKHLFRL